MQTKLLYFSHFWRQFYQQVSSNLYITFLVNLTLREDKQTRL